MAILLSISLVLIGCNFVKPSVEYDYRSSPASQWHNHNSFGSGASYTSVPVEPHLSEGYYVDPHLLESIKHIILKDEVHNAAHGYSENDGTIVGIELLDIQQSIEVAQYHQGDHVTEDYASRENHGVPLVSHSNYYTGSSQSHSALSGPHDTTSTSYDVPIESSYEVAQSSTPESDSSLLYNNGPVLSTPFADADDNHNSHNSPATVYGPSLSSSSNHNPTDEETHTLNVRNARRTPFYRSSYRPKFYKFRH